MKSLAPNNCSVSIIVTCTDMDWSLTLCYQLFTLWLMHIKTEKDVERSFIAALVCYCIFQRNVDIFIVIYI